MKSLIPSTSLVILASCIALWYSVPVSAQTTVTEIRVIDGDGNGVISQIKEVTRNGDKLEVGDTDTLGYYRRPLKCPASHKLVAEPIAGPYSFSHFKACEVRMVLQVYRVSSYPEASVRIIVPFPPGGPADVLARIIAQDLSRPWAQQVIVENRPGANGIIGTSYVSRESPNGYILLWGTSQIFSINPVIRSNLPYNPEKDFMPVSLVAATPEFLVAATSFPIQSVNELLEVAKAKPDTINFASAGPSTASHLAGELFRSSTGIRITHIPYKGAKAATSAVIAGDVQIAFAGASPVLDSNIKAGKLRVLGVTGSNRSALYPDAPTLAESGVRGYEVTNWHGIFGPSGIPDSIVQKLNFDIHKSLNGTDVRHRLRNVSAQPIGNTPEQFAAVIKAEKLKWARVVREAGFKAH